MKELQDIVDAIEFDEDGVTSGLVDGVLEELRDNTDLTFNESMVYREEAWTMLSKAFAEWEPETDLEARLEWALNIDQQIQALRR